MDKTKILAVDDEKDLLLGLKARLQREGYLVHCASSAESGLLAARAERPDLVLLDIELPGMDGLEMFRRLRAETSVPVIFLTGRAAELDRVLGLRLGADDYVAKPFSLDELSARVAAVLRRARPEPSGARRFGALEVDLPRREVRVNGRPRALAPSELRVLSLLIEADGRALDREDLLRGLWGVDRSAELSTRAVDQHVARLRRKLLTEKERIVTVKSSGYRLRLD
ncbi:MAG: response regulator transcription factor [Elusimicrobia bacterium]|nr:response regulator transcription factor [Elusimicrobiota bacterium]